MALPNESRRPSGGGRRPEDAPRLTAVPTTTPTGPAPAGLPPLPGVLAQAVLDKPAPAPQEPRQVAPTTAPAPPPEPAPEPEHPAEEPEQPDDDSEAAPEGGQIAVVESQSAADAERAIKWLGVTFRPPDVWRERQPCLAEEWAFVMDGSHLPEEGLWRALARGYAAPAIAVITALHFAIWVLRSPARHATAWAVALVAAVSAAFML